MVPHQMWSIRVVTLRRGHTAAQGSHQQDSVEYIIMRRETIQYFIWYCLHDSSLIAGVGFPTFSPREQRRLLLFQSALLECNEEIIVI